MTQWFLRYRRWPEYQGAIQLAVICQRVYEAAPRSRLAQAVDSQCTLLVQGIVRGSIEVSRAHAVDTLHRTLGGLALTRATLQRLRQRRTGPQASVVAALEVAERVEEALGKRIATLLERRLPER